MPLNSAKVSIAEAVLVMAFVFGSIIADVLFGIPALSWFARGLLVGSFLMFLSNVIDEHLSRDFERSVQMRETPQSKRAQKIEKAADQQVEAVAEEMAADAEQKKQQVNGNAN